MTTTNDHRRRPLCRVLTFVLALALCPALARAQEGPVDPLGPFNDIALDTRVPTIEGVLGHAFGERFTRHDRLLDYCEALASASDRVRIDDYGRTHLDRRLVTLTITSPANHRRLDEILRRNRALTDPGAADRADIIEKNPAVVWFSFSVHGNEGSNSEAGLALAYALAATRDRTLTEALDDVVLVIDPCLNPDGRERYVSWFETVMGRGVDERPDAAEHFEPWPGGRSNHYCFDLNRDWVWGVHPESHARVAWYRRFMPQLHIDWHEQGYSSPAFFGEGDTPYNANIPESTKRWVAEYTEAVAQGYDALGLVFATRERFDYLYPGYGKVLPCYHGAVGILNEQAGHSRGGLAIEVDEGYTLTLAERIRNQLVIARRYIEHTAERRRDQLHRFHGYFDTATRLSEGGAPAGFLLSGRNTPGQMRLVWRLANMHGFDVHPVTARRARGAVAHSDGARADTLDVPAGSWWIPVDQPMGRLVLTLFERSSFIEDPDTYDITGWSVPVMLGLEAWTVDEPVEVGGAFYDDPTTDEPAISGAPFDRAVATVVPADRWDFTVALGIAAEHGLFARLTGEESTLNGQKIPAGSLLLHTIRTDDETRRAFERDLVAAGFSAVRLASGLTQTGPVLGANENRRFIVPRVMLPRGDDFSSYSFGQVWHMLDVAYPLPHTVVPAGSFRSVKTADFNVLVLPSGRPGSMASAEAIERWVRDGGTVVALGSSAFWASRELLNLTTQDTDDDRPELSELSYAEREDRGVEDRIPGAVFRAIVDTTHPITFGGPLEVGVIKRSSTPLPVRDNGYVVARFAEEAVVGGAVSDRNARRIAGTPFVTHHTLGGGNVICFSDDITMRGFNHAGMRLLLNTIAKGPSFARELQPLGE